MDFGNPKKLRNLTICILFRVLKRLEKEGEGGLQIVEDFVTRLMRPKYLFKKIRQKMHIYTIGEQEIWFHYFFNPYYFRTSVKTTFKGKKFNKAAIKCNLSTGFLTTYLKILAKLV